MIDPYRRKRLIQNIESLGPEAFHWVGIYFLSFVTGKAIHSKGVNRNNKAVGHANDAISLDGTTVAEFSTEEGYFTWKKKAKKQYVKAAGDVQHAIALQKGATRVYLISSQKCTASELTKLQKNLKRRFGSVIGLHIFNSEFIADTIIAGIERSEAFTDEIEKYLPEISYLKAEEQHNSNFPKPSFGYHERSCKEEILTHLKNSKTVIVHGLSGSGKTELLKKIGEELRQNFQYRLWINGDDLVDETSLGKVSFSRLGKTANVLEIIKSFKTLICIDSFEGNRNLLDVLSNSPCVEGCKIVITSQIVYSGDGMTSFEVRGVDLDTFSSILNQGLQPERRCPSEQAEEFHGCTDGHVMIASILNRYVKESDLRWEDLRDINSAIEILEDHKSQKLIEILLKKYSQNLKNELDVLREFKSKLIEPYLLSKMINIIGVINLQKRSLIWRGENGLFKIHDLIFKALHHERASGDQGQQFAEKLLSVLEAQLDLEEGMSSFSHSLLIHKDLILEIEGRISDSRTEYLKLLVSEDSHFDDSLYPEFKAFKDFKEKILADKFKVFSYIEFNEIVYRKIRYLEERPKEVYVEFLKEGISHYDYMLGNIASDDLKLYLLHHRGKAKSIIGDSSAKQDYEDALKIKNDFYAGMLQLFKFEARNNTTDKHNFLIENILEAASKDFSKVSLPVLLACFQDLRRVNFNKSRKGLIHRYGSLFKRTILLSTVDGYSFAYETLAGFGHDVGLVDEKVIREIYGLINFPLPTVNDANKRLNIGLALRSIGATLKDKQISSKASAYFEGLDFKKIGGYHSSHIAFFYIDLGEYKKSLEILRSIEEKDHGAFVCLRFSQAYLGLKDKKMAQDWIGSAIEKIADKDKEKHLASFISVKRAIESLSDKN